MGYGEVNLNLVIQTTHSRPRPEDLRHGRHQTRRKANRDLFRSVARKLERSPLDVLAQ